MGGRQPYPSDLSDEAWELIRPVITSWKGQHRSVSGHEGRYEMREILNAILYQARVGCQWRYCPSPRSVKTVTAGEVGSWQSSVGSSNRSSVRVRSGS
ncbi:transposase [Streptomyces sp. NBC_01615]